ncbi:MAG: EamA family transporter, partial [Actinomycetota bacterium]
FDDLAPASVAWFRVIGAALVLIAVSIPTLRRDGRWTRNELISVSLFGISTALMNLFFYLAIQHLDLGKGVAIEFIGPITVAALRTRTSRNALALVCAVIGVLILSGIELGNEPVGLFFIFLASIMWAAYIVIGAKVARFDRGVSGLGVGLLIGAIFIAPFGAPTSGPAFSAPWILATCFLVGILSNAIGYGIDQYTLRRIPVRRFSILLALLPVTATIFGLVFLDQVPSITDLIGISFVLAGVVVQQRDTLPATEVVA